MPGNSKRRRRKHRGTQTGSIDRRSRSRPRNRQEAMAQARSGGGRKGGKAARQPVDRRAKPPTWKGAATRGILFAALLLPVSLLFGQPVGGAIVLTVIAAGFYVPLGYWTETFFHRRYMRRLQRERAQAAAAKAQRRKPRPRQAEEERDEDAEAAKAGKG